MDKTQPSVSTRQCTSKMRAAMAGWQALARLPAATVAGNSHALSYRAELSDLVRWGHSRCPFHSLLSGRWVKLICGASFEDVAQVRILSLVYTLAGVVCIDCAAEASVVRAEQAVREGIEAAAEVALSVDGHDTLSLQKPWIMVSINDDEDVHFRKAEFDSSNCPSSCPRPCERICPACALRFSSALEASQNHLPKISRGDDNKRDGMDFAHRDLILESYPMKAKIIHYELLAKNYTTLIMLSSLQMTALIFRKLLQEHDIVSKEDDETILMSLGKVYASNSVEDSEQAFQAKGRQKADNRDSDTRKELESHNRAYVAQATLAKDSAF